MSNLANELKRGSPLDDEIIEECIALWGHNGPQAFTLYLELFNRRRTTLAMERGIFGSYYTEAQHRGFVTELTPLMRRDYLLNAWRKGQDLGKVRIEVDHLKRLLEKKLFSAERRTWVKPK
jgi:hypothetical protein